MSESIKKPAGCNAATAFTDTGRISIYENPIYQATATCAGKIIQFEQVVSVARFSSAPNEEPTIQDNLNTLLAGLCLGSECPNFVAPTTVDVNTQFPSQQ